MYIYWLILISIVILYFVFNKNNTMFIISSFFILASIGSFRSSDVGADTRLYEFLFLNPSITENKNPVYSMYSVLLSNISDVPHTITASNSILICLLFGIFIYRLHFETKYTLYSIFLFITMFFFGNSLCTSRQYIAMGIVVNAVIFLFEKKVFKYLILSMLAIGVHSTAIVSLVALFLYFLKQNKKTVYILIFCSALIIVFYNKIIEIFTSIFTDYDMYSNGNNMLQITTTGAGASLIYNIFIFIIFIFFIFTIFKYKINLNKMEFNFICLFGVYAVLDLVFTNVVFLQRIFMYFSIFGTAVIPMYFQKIEHISEKNTFKLLNTTFIIFMIIYYYIQLSHDYIGIVPYIFN